MAHSPEETSLMLGFGARAFRRRLSRRRPTVSGGQAFWERGWFALRRPGNHGARKGQARPGRILDGMGWAKSGSCQLDASSRGEGKEEGGKWREPGGNTLLETTRKADLPEGYHQLRILRSGWQPRSRSPHPRHPLRCSACAPLRNTDHMRG